MASSDFLRIDPNLLEHPKIVRLLNKYGAPGFVSLFLIWSHAAKFNPSGRLEGITPKELGIIAKVPGRQPEKFINFLVEVRLLDRDGETLAVHGWAERQPFLATAEERAERNRNAAIARWGRRGPVKSATPADATPMHDASDVHTKPNAQTIKRSNGTNELEDWYDREFLSRYPLPRREDQRASALTELRKLKPSPEKLQQIIAGLDLWNCSPGWTDEGGKFAPGPGKFLKAKSYERTPPPVANTNGNGKPRADLPTGAEYFAREMPHPHAEETNG